MSAKIAVVAAVGALGAAVASVLPASETAQAATHTPAPDAPSASPAAPAASAAPAPSTSSTRPAAEGRALHYVVAPEGNEARYFAREQLAGVSFPNDAIGVTKKVTGALVLDANGKVVPGESKFIVDVTQLKSDRDRRDGYVQRRTLETAKFPTVDLVPKEVRGLQSPLPDSGRATFQLLGDLTVKGVTRPTTWEVSARFRGDTISGTASTGFTFDDFDMEKPSVSIVISVKDSLYLQYDFRLVPGK